MRNQTLVAFLFVTLACQNQNQMFDIQGHRGCRGLYPENSVEGFLAAIELGVQTLELDLVVSKDHQLIVSHEPWFSEDFCRKPNGDSFRHNDSLNNIYQLDYDQIKLYDCGSWGNNRFPEQIQMKTHKPNLSDVVTASEKASKNNIHYNIELKRRPEWDGKYLPSVHEFVDLVTSEVRDLGIAERTTLQSFDFETLQILKSKAPEMQLAALLESTFSVENVLTSLNFKPAIISPLYSILSKDLVEEIHSSDMRVIPWTVNEKLDMEKLMEMGVDGIITDYPDRLIPLVAAGF